MRPARKGPETMSAEAILVGVGHGFNEAGPQGAGNGPAPLWINRLSVCFNEAGPQGAGNVAPALYADSLTAPLQ